MRRRIFPYVYLLILGTVLDLNTFHTTMEKVTERLDIGISNFVLDAGYTSKEMIQSFTSQNEIGKSMASTYLRKTDTPTIHYSINRQRT